MSSKRKKTALPAPAATNKNVLRVRDGEARVTNEELFFDLIYAFAVTQLAHRLGEHLTFINAIQTLVLWYGVWLGWQYTSWVTNWFNPEHRGMRLMLFGVMLAGLIMSTAIPTAFAEGGFTFAICYALIQLGRTLYVLWHLGRRNPLTANYRRILAWLCVSTVFWIAGAMLEEQPRLLLWAIAVACEYFSPMVGFRFPGLGKSLTTDWTIDGGHLAERCQLFVIVALGESILATGAAVGHSMHFDAPTVISLLVTFVASVAMWWIYFDTSSKDGSHAITHSRDPGRIGAYFHYIHVTLIAGIIVVAVGDHMILDKPDAKIDMAAMCVIIGGPLIYLVGDAAYRKVVYGKVSRSYLVGMAALLALIPFSFMTDRLMVAGLVMVILWFIAICGSRGERGQRIIVQET